MPLRPVESAVRVDSLPGRAMPRCPLPQETLVSSRQTLPLTVTAPAPSVEGEATTAPSSAQSTPSTTTTPTSAEEVTTMAQRLRRLLLHATIDTARIDAHRDAVQRELGLSRPVL